MIAGHRVASGRRCFSRRRSHKLSSGRFKTILGMAQNFLACDPRAGVVVAAESARVAARGASVAWFVIEAVADWTSRRSMRLIARMARARWHASRR